MSEWDDEPARVAAPEPGLRAAVDGLAAAITWMPPEQHVRLVDAVAVTLREAGRADAVAYWRAACFKGILWGVQGGDDAGGS